jgi:hypothetical protein
MEQPVAMTIDKELADGKLTLKVCGRLDTNTSPKLEEELKLGEVLEVAFVVEMDDEGSLDSYLRV